MFSVTPVRVSCELECIVCGEPVRGRPKPGTEGKDYIYLQIQPCVACVKAVLAERSNRKEQS